MKENIKKRNRNLIIVLGVVGVLLISAWIISIYSNREVKVDKSKLPEDKPLVENYKISMYDAKDYHYDDEKIRIYSFFKPGNIEDININEYSYTCPNNNCTGVYINKNYAIIKDDKKIYVYNYVSSEVVLEYANTYEIKFSYNFSTNEAIGLIIKSNKKLYGYYNFDKNELTVPIEYDSLSNNGFGTENSVLNNTMIVSKKNKFGLVNIENGNLIMEVKNDYINYVDGSVLKVKNKNVYKLHDFSGNALLNGIEYTDIYTTGPEIIYVLNKNGINVVNLNGEVVMTLGTITNDYKFDYVSPSSEEIGLNFKIDKSDNMCHYFGYNFVNKTKNDKKEKCS